MVYIHFPVNLTEEELMLQTKYQKLKKKKKAIHALKTPKQETEKPIIPKRPTDARDAREVARKLLKSGAIQAIQKPATKQDQTSFKRPKGQERKKIVVDTNVSLYQPFPAAQDESFQENTVASSGTREDDSSSAHIQTLYQQFETTRDRIERGVPVETVKRTTTESPAATLSKPEKPRGKNTICVSGTNLTEDYLRKYFVEFGEVVNYSMEIEKGRGFISFSKPESSEKAIAKMHNKCTGGILLQVQLARRQPHIVPMTNATVALPWATIATSNSQKGSLKDTREVVTYDEEDLFSVKSEPSISAN